ncbi:AraC family transcriptional regulator [Pelagicoccus mobilis]|uniref:Helix-turn-helix transcriptional regulator n=1 Tax=Pelagicoccus mobilis TaxID=415221 RepID=A0A934RVN3_9BACT|nr:AraC family transcriptional regulator [Pelagicoccus mobilis]MBK1876285.1 helix-turn-helix transcriptional regulator [Pelagicoccus mobilis]
MPERADSLATDQTTFCPFKAPSRISASAENQEVSLNRFEQRPGMSFVHAEFGASATDTYCDWPAHSFLQIAYLTSGRLQLKKADGVLLNCKAGDWLLLKPANSPFQFAAQSDCSLHWLGFDPEAAEGLTGFSETISPQLLDQTTPLLSNHASNGRLKALGNELSKLKGETTRERLLIEAKTLEWLVLILDQPAFSPCKAIIPQGNAREDTALTAAARILEERLAEDHSIAEISRAVHLNEFKLKRGFKQRFGTTIFGYLRQKRMEAARSKLQRGGISIIEVANAVGYSNPSHFARAFKEAFGVNPSQLTG